MGTLLSLEDASEEEQALRPEEGKLTEERGKKEEGRGRGRSVLAILTTRCFVYSFLFIFQKLFFVFWRYPKHWVVQLANMS